uniref:Uncharacterized protein n=2 Tax=Parascaris univalens TaxID=6257 RepID=A0A914ZP58_PARUN
MDSTESSTGRLHYEDSVERRLMKSGSAEKRRKKVHKRADLRSRAAESESEVELLMRMASRNVSRSRNIKSNDGAVKRVYELSSSRELSSSSPSEGDEPCSQVLKQKGQIPVRCDQKDCGNEGNMSEASEGVLSGVTSHSPSKEALFVRKGGDERGTLEPIPSYSRQKRSQSHSDNRSVDESGMHSAMKLCLRWSGSEERTLAANESPSQRSVSYVREMQQLADLSNAVDVGQKSEASSAVMVGGLVDFNATIKLSSDELHFISNLESSRFSSSSSTPPNVTLAASPEAVSSHISTREAQGALHPDQKLSEFDRILAKFEREQRVEKEERENASRDNADRSALANDSLTIDVTKQRLRNRCSSGLVADCSADDDDSVEGEQSDKIRQRVPTNATSQNHNGPIEAGNETSTVTAISSQRLMEPICDKKNERLEETSEWTNKRITPSRSVLVPATMMPQGHVPSLSESDEGGLASDDGRHLTDNELLVDGRAETNNSTSELGVETMLGASIFRHGEQHANSKGVGYERTLFHDSVGRNNVDTYAAGASAGKRSNRSAIHGLYGLLLKSELSALDEQVLRVTLVDGQPCSIDMADSSTHQRERSTSPDVLSNRSFVGQEAQQTSGIPSNIRHPPPRQYSLFRRDPTAGCEKESSHKSDRVKPGEKQWETHDATDILECPLSERWRRNSVDGLPGCAPLHDQFATMLSRSTPSLAHHTAAQQIDLSDTAHTPRKYSVKKRHRNKQPPSMRSVLRYATFRLYKDLKMLVAERERTIAALENATQYSLLDGLSFVSRHYQQRFVSKLIENKVDLDVRIDGIWRRLIHPEHARLLSHTQNEWLFSVPCSTLLVTHRTYAKQRRLMARIRSSNRTQLPDFTEPSSVSAQLRNEALWKSLGCPPRCLQNAATLTFK